MGEKILRRALKLLLGEESLARPSRVAALQTQIDAARALHQQGLEYECLVAPRQMIDETGIVARALESGTIGQSEFEALSNAGKDALPGIVRIIYDDPTTLLA